MAKQVTITKEVGQPAGEITITIKTETTKSDGTKTTTTFSGSSF